MGGIDAGFIACPWFIEEYELKTIGGTLSIAAAETNPNFPIKMRYNTETLLGEIAGRSFQMTFYGHAAHGFIHDDPNDDAAHYASEGVFCRLCSGLRSI